MILGWTVVLATVVVILITLRREEGSWPRAIGAFLFLFLWTAVLMMSMAGAAYVVLR